MAIFRKRSDAAISSLSDLTPEQAIAGYVDEFRRAWNENDPEGRRFTEILSADYTDGMEGWAAFGIGDVLAGHTVRMALSSAPEPSVFFLSAADTDDMTDCPEAIQLRIARRLRTAYAALWLKHAPDTFVRAIRRLGVPEGTVEDLSVGLGQRSVSELTTWALSAAWPLDAAWTIDAVLAAVHGRTDIEATVDGWPILDFMMHPFAMAPLYSSVEHNIHLAITQRETLNEILADLVPN